MARAVAKRTATTARIVKRVIAALGRVTPETPRAALERAFARIPTGETFELERRRRRNVSLAWSKRYESSMSRLMMGLSGEDSAELVAATQLWAALAAELRAVHGKPKVKRALIQRWKVAPSVELGCTTSGTSTGFGGVAYTVSVWWQFGRPR